MNSRSFGTLQYRPIQLDPLIEMVLNRVFYFKKAETFLYMYMSLKTCIIIL